MVRLDIDLNGNLEFLNGFHPGSACSGYLTTAYSMIVFDGIRGESRLSVFDACLRPSSLDMAVGHCIVARVRPMDFGEFRLESPGIMKALSVGCQGVVVLR